MDPMEEETVTIRWVLRARGCRRGGIRRNCRPPARRLPAARARPLIPPPGPLPLDRRLPDEDLSVREVRISCPDATGLGVDICRCGSRVLAAAGG